MTRETQGSSPVTTFLSDRRKTAVIAGLVPAISRRSRPVGAGIARCLRRPAFALSALVNERARISSEMAIRIEKPFGVSMDTLMRMQNSFDIAQARERARKINVAPFAGKPLDVPPARGTEPAR